MKLTCRGSLKCPIYGCHLYGCARLAADKEQRGFLALGNITPYVALAVGVVMLCMGWALHHEYKRANKAEAEHAAFVAATAEIGKAAQREADAQRLADQRNKERADEESKRRTADRTAELNRLRDKYASRSFVPAPAPGSRITELACFDRAELDAAIRRLARGAVEIAGKGTEATIDLDIVKRWAQR